MTMGAANHEHLLPQLSNNPEVLSTVKERIYLIRIFKTKRKTIYSFLPKTTQFSRNPLIEATISPTEILVLVFRKVMENPRNTKLLSIV